MMIDGLDNDDCDDNDLIMYVPTGHDHDCSEDDECDDNDLSIQVRFQWKTNTEGMTVRMKIFMIMI